MYSLTIFSSSNSLLFGQQAGPVQAEDVPQGKIVESNRAFFTMVAVDLLGEKVQVPEVVPHTDEERAYYASALRRRQLRLVLAGRMKPEEANELKSIFDIS